VSVKLFDTASCSPLVSEEALLLGVVTRGCAEVSARSCFGLRNRLFSKVFAHVIGLVFVVFLDFGRHAAGLWQAPSGEVCFSGGVSSGLRHITARTHLHRRGNMQLKAVALATVSSKAKGVEGASAEFRLVLGLVLGGTGIAFKRRWGHPGFCANFRSTNSLFPSQVSVDRVVEEHIIFIVIELGLDRAHLDLVSEREERFL